MSEIIMKEIIIKSQKEFDELDTSTKAIINIDFGDKDNPAKINKNFPKGLIYIIDTYANIYSPAVSVHAYGNSYIKAYNDILVFAYDETTVEAHHNAHVISIITDDVKIILHDESRVFVTCTSKNVVIDAYGSSFVEVAEQSIATINIKSRYVRCKICEGFSGQLTGYTPVGYICS